MRAHWGHSRHQGRKALASRLQVLQHWRMGGQGRTEEPGGEGLFVAGLCREAVPQVIEDS